jgi:hypothetical protein
MATMSPIFAAVTAYNDMQERDAVRSDVKNTFKGKASGVAEVLGRTGSTDTASASVRKVLEDTAEIQKLSADFEGKTITDRTNLAKEYQKAGKITKEQQKIFSQEHMGTYISAMEKQGEALTESAKIKFPEFDRKAKALSAATGTSTKEISDLALKMGVDLTDGTMKMSEAMEKLGLATNKTTEEIQANTRAVVAERAQKLFGDPLEKSKTEQALNMSAEGLAQSGAGFSEDQYNQFMLDLTRQSSVLFKGDPIAAARFMQQQVGSMGATQFGEGAVFGAPGMAERFQQFGAGTATADLFNTAVNTQATGVTDNLTQRLLAGSEMSLDAGVAGDIRNMLVKGYQDPANAATMKSVEAKLQELSLAGGVKDSEGRLLTGEAGAVALEQALSAILVPLMPEGGMPFKPGEAAFGVSNLEDANTAAADAANSMSNAAKEMGSSITELLESQPNWWSNPPKWYNDNSKPAWIGSDTTTPRANGDSTSSRLGRTMSRHGFFDSQLAGSRTVTSAWRNNNLGSINSDHVTGNAYDLTGQNLGAYGTMVNSMGGFAEFHGSGGGRHLHVVPGQTPVGDSMSPVASSGVAVMGGGSNSYSITINTQPGQDANAIAQEVMARIADRDRSNMERQ